MLTLPYPPTANHLYATVRGRKILSKQGRQYKATCAALARAAGLQPITGPVGVVLHAYRPRRAGDLDNTLKAVLDSVKGIAWGDDSQIEEIHAHRYDDKDNPRVELSAAAIGVSAPRTRHSEPQEGRA